jgi:hypothetical protein
MYLLMRLADFLPACASLFYGSYRIVLSGDICQWLTSDFPGLNETKRSLTFTSKITSGYTGISEQVLSLKISTDDIVSKRTAVLAGEIFIGRNFRETIDSRDKNETWLPNIGKGSQVPGSFNEFLNHQTPK